VLLLLVHFVRDAAQKRLLSVSKFASVPVYYGVALQPVVCIILLQNLIAASISTSVLKKQNELSKVIIT
jgi:hypothetical protein